jgi:hypothetical protein
MMSFLESVLKLLQGFGLFRVSELKSNSRQDSVMTEMISIQWSVRFMEPETFDSLPPQYVSGIPGYINHHPDSACVIPSTPVTRHITLPLLKPTSPPPPPDLSRPTCGR